MLGNLGYYSGKGMVLVPDLSGLSSSAAQAAITSAGLIVGSISSTSSGATSGNNGQVASTTPSSGTLVDYETSVSFVTYSYSEPPPPPNPPSWIDSSISDSFIQGSAYSDSVSATNGASYQIVQDNSCFGNVISPYWVEGVYLDSSTGVLSGTPTTAGQTYSFRIRAYNGGGYVDTAPFCGSVDTPSGTVTSVSVIFDSVTSSSQLTGKVRYVNNTGATYSIQITTSAGTVSPKSFLSNGNVQSVTEQAFTVTGLSGNQTVTVTAQGGGVGSSSSATTLSGGGGGGTPTYTFSSAYGGSGSLSCSGTVISNGSVPTNGSSGYTITVNAGLCGSQSIYAFAPGTFYWQCCQT